MSFLMSNVLDEQVVVKLLKDILNDAGCRWSLQVRIEKLLKQYEDEQSRPKCTCGCWGDPGCCGHSPDCPMKKIEG
jgi:hypothetical protein